MLIPFFLPMINFYYLCGRKQKIFDIQKQMKL